MKTKKRRSIFAGALGLFLTLGAVTQNVTVAFAQEPGEAVYYGTDSDNHAPETGGGTDNLNALQASDENPTEEPPKAAQNDLYTSYINLVGEKTAFYGGEIITLYNNIVISGNQTVLEEGSYSVITIPKSSFQKPVEKDISTSFTDFKNLTIEETDSDYRIITVYKTLYGGYNAGTPVKLSLIPGGVVNRSNSIVKQEFFDKNGIKLTDTSQVNIIGKAEIEKISNNNWGASRLKNEVDEHYVIKQGTYRTFHPYYTYVLDNQNDPRDRRIYAAVPDGTSVKADTGWTYEESTGRYYKDIPRNKWNNSNITIELDLGGIDMSSFDSQNKYKRFEVVFSTQPVVDGVVQTDVGPYRASSKIDYYILKSGPVVPGATQRVYNYVYNKTINRDYQPVNGNKSATGSYHLGSGYYSDRNLTYLSYNHDLLNSQRIRYSLANLTSYGIYNGKGDDDTRELSFTSSHIEVSPYTNPSEIRIMVLGLNEEDTETLKNMLHGTKAYGWKDGVKTLISEDVPVVSYGSYTDSHTSEGWQKLNGEGDYSEISFEYPETLKFIGKSNIDKFYKAIWNDVVADIKESAYTELADKLSKEEAPVINYKADYGRLYLKGKYVVNAGEEATENTAVVSDSTRDEFRMYYEDIIKTNNISITTGSQYFVDETLTAKLSYTQNRYGNFADATMPENANIYYLVPDGLEPVDDGETFSDIKVVRGYIDGFNLVTAKPAKTDIPKSSGAINDRSQNTYELSFTVTGRLQTGTYKIYSCMSIDNNKIGVDENGTQYGILQRDNPGSSTVWKNILNDAENRPDNRLKFTDFSSETFTIYPPKVLSSFKEVKLSKDPDSKYASSLGNKATIGTPIDYRWLLKNNSTGDIDTLEVIDILPYSGDKSIVASDSGEYTSRGSTFKTPLTGVDANEKFDIYYSTDPVKGTIKENTAAAWSASVDDYSSVTMIKAVLKTGQKLSVGESCSIVTHNIIENNDKIQDGQKAHNSFAVSLNDGNSFAEALGVEVAVNYPKRDVQILKSDLENQNKRLYNAVFTLYEEGTGENGGDRLIKDDITTNHDGIATIPNLLVGKEYYLIEKKAPEGYERSEDRLYFTVNEADETNSVQRIDISNDIKRTSVGVTKKWIGPAADNVNVHLLADGVDTGKSLTLDESNNWKGTFDKLPELNNDGSEISYTVSETPITDYSSSITGDAKTGYVITNKNTEKISIPVKKEWIGPPTDKVSIKLEADGNVVDEIVLNDDNNWSGSFEGFLKYDADDGHEISYTVSEDETADYATSITGDAVNGFTVTNTKKPTGSIPPVDEENVPPSDDEPENPTSHSDEGYEDPTPPSGEKHEDPVSPDNVKNSENNTDKTDTTPKTGDNMQYGIWIILAAAGMAGAVLTAVAKKKIKRR